MSFARFKEEILQHPDVDQNDNSGKFVNGVNAVASTKFGGMKYTIRSNIPREQFKIKVLAKLKTLGGFTVTDFETEPGSAIMGSKIVISDGPRTENVFIAYKNSKGTSVGNAKAAETTNHGESWQAICMAARFKKGSDLVDVVDVLNNHNANRFDGIDPKKCVGKLEETGWLESGINIANYASRFSFNQHHFHWQSKVVDTIYKMFSVGQKVSGYKLGPDKWNPADIWAFKSPDNFMTKLKAIESKVNELGLSVLNEFMFDSFISGEAIGLSLKKNEGQPVKYKELNNPGEPALNVKFNGFKNHKLSQFNTNDIYVLFTLDGKDGGEIQFRVFSGLNHQGQIAKAPGSTKSAVHGKVGAYAQFLEKHIVDKSMYIEDNSANARKVRSRDPKLMSNLESFYGFIEPNTKGSKIYDVVNGQHDKLFSKYFGIQIVYHMMKMTPAQRDKLTTQFVAYGMSQIPDVSCVHGKFQ